LIILAAIPACCAIWLGTSLTRERIRELHEFVAFEEAMGLANCLAEVNEANDAELGCVWSWSLTAEKENGTAVVTAMRNTWEENGKALDDAYSRLEGRTTKLDFSAYDPKLREILNEVAASKQKLGDHRVQVRKTMDYVPMITPYNELKTRIQALYPALLKETSDKELAQRLTSYNLYVDFHGACVQYTGVMIWAHQIPKLPPNGYARYESYFRESETLLKHFRNLAPPTIVAQVDALLSDDRGRWVDEKVRSFLNNNTDDFHDFGPHRSLEQELKAKAEGRNTDLGKIAGAIREDIMKYAAARIEGMKWKRNITVASLVLALGITVAVTLSIATALSRLIARITEGLADGAKHVLDASIQISEASVGLAESASSQADGVDQTVNMIGAIRTLIGETTTNAQKATAAISNTSKVVAQSRANMADMKSSIGQIATNSTQTKKILHTIDEIAFQTNILALNAAVEAARAGELGAGFAIVAEEVRSLAQRSASAANSTNELIEKSHTCIDSGAAATERANTSLERLLGCTGQVEQCITAIEESAQHQVRAIGEVSDAASKVGALTHGTAAAAEQCAASALTLKEQATNLEDYVMQFEDLVFGRRS
jgi:methyl-accepting chemotaxis protein